MKATTSNRRIAFVELLRLSSNSSFVGLRLASLTLLVLLSLSITVAQTDGLKDSAAVRVAGTRVSLLAPTGFVPSTQFPGYWKEADNSSIVISEVPGPYGELAAGFSDAAVLAQRGITLLNKQDVTIDGQPGLLVHVRQTAHGTDFLKWVLLTGDARESLMVVATFPKELMRTHSRALKESILGVRWERAKSVSFDEGLNFGVVEKGEFRFLKRLTNTLLYSTSDVFPNKSVADPVFIAGSSLSKITVADPKSFSEARILSTAGVTEVMVEESKAVTIDALSGHEVIASGKDRETGEPMIIFQTILFDGPIYYIMQGLVSTTRAPEHLTTFREMTKSFTRKK